MAPCVVVERLEGKHLCSRAQVGAARRTPSPRMTKVTVHEKRKVNEQQSNPAAAHHTITTVRRPDNTRLSALIHSVHGPPKSLITEAISQNEVTFVPFSRVFWSAYANFNYHLARMDCIVLQHVAACCGMLHYVATCCTVLPCVATCSHVL